MAFTSPPELADAVLAATGRRQHRSLFLAAWLVVYYLPALPLFVKAGYEEVMRNLAEGVEGLPRESGWSRVARCLLSRRSPRAAPVWGEAAG